MERKAILWMRWVLAQRCWVIFALAYNFFVILSCTTAVSHAAIRRWNQALQEGTRRKVSSLRHVTYALHSPNFTLLFAYVS
jgi:hypothetical protein